MKNLPTITYPMSMSTQVYETTILIPVKVSWRTYQGTDVHREERERDVCDAERNVVKIAVSIETQVLRELDLMSLSFNPGDLRERVPVGITHEQMKHRGDTLVPPMTSFAGPHAARHVLASASLDRHDRFRAAAARLGIRSEEAETTFSEAFRPVLRAAGMGPKIYMEGSEIRPAFHVFNFAVERTQSQTKPWRLYKVGICSDSKSNYIDGNSTHTIVDRVAGVLIRKGDCVEVWRTIRSLVETAYGLPFVADWYVPPSEEKTPKKRRNPIPKRAPTYYAVGAVITESEPVIFDPM